MSTKPLTLTWNVMLPSNFYQPIYPPMMMKKPNFKAEAKASAALNHRNIATIHAIEEDTSVIFIVLEYIEGIELRQL